MHLARLCIVKVFSYSFRSAWAFRTASVLGGMVLSHIMSNFGASICISADSINTWFSWDQYKLSKGCSASSNFELLQEVYTKNQRSG